MPRLLHALATSLPARATRAQRLGAAAAHIAVLTGVPRAEAIKLAKVFVA